MKKRVLSALLALCLAFSLFGTALAAPAETPSETASTSSSESTTVQENGTEGTDSGDSSVSSTGETGNTGTDSSSGENADSNSTELTGTDTTGNDSQTGGESHSDDAAATAADGAADDAATADATNETDSYAWGGQDGGGGGTSGTYNHIDVKTAAAYTGDDNAQTVSSVDRVTYIDISGRTGEVTFRRNVSNGEYTHQRMGAGNFNDDTIITITFTLGNGQNAQTYTSTLTKSSTYPENTYYPSNGANAPKLRTYLGLPAYSDEDIEISGMSVFLVSAIVCDGSTVNGKGSLTRVMGLDLVLNVATLLGTTPNFDFVVEKTLNGSNTLKEDQFTFTFQEANRADDSIWTVSDKTNTQTLQTAAQNGENGAAYITQTIDGDPVAYPTSSKEGTVYHYYILREIAGDEPGVTYDDTIYGIVVAVKTERTSTSGSSTTEYSTTVKSVQVYQLNATENGEYTQDEVMETITRNNDGDYVFPFINTYDPGPEITTLTLQKTFVGLSAAEVNYLIFGQSSGFGWDIDYCQTTTHPVDGNDSKQTFMAVIDESDYITLSDGTEISAGGDFSITAEQFLCCGDNGITSFDGSEYTNHKTGASLTQDSAAGNWVFSVTIDVYKTDDTHFYTVFEQHQEVPGYAKINDSNATWTISGSTDKTGYGKFIDTAGGNIYENMPTEVNGGETTVADTTYNELEDVAIALGYFERLRITGATTISFTNNYTGDLEVAKKYGDESAYTDANKTFTITVAPADPEKLALDTGTHGLSGKTFSYTIKNEDGTVTTPTNPKVTLDSNGSFTIELKAGQTVHFTDMPAIQWVVTESETATGNAVEGYTLKADITDTNNGVVNEVTHWNDYSATDDDDVIGSTFTTDGIASVDSAVRNIDDPAVNASAVALVTVTNTYARKTNTLTISKHVSGPMGDTTADFTFTVELTDTLDNNAAYTKEVETVKSTDSVGWSGSDGTYTLTLSDGEYITLTLPYGVTATVEETNVQGHTVYSRVYNTGTTVGDNADFDPANDKTLDYVIEKSQTVTLTGVNQSVDFMNYRDAATPTGVDTDSAAPYLVLTACAAFAGLALAGSIVAVRLRRRRQE